MLSVGLLTEAFIFALSAFEPVDNELDWSLVYPELVGVKGHEAKRRNLFRFAGMLSQN
jgi:gliding motility-associated protein GldL